MSRLERTGRWCARHRLVVVLLWLDLLLAAAGGSVAIGASTTDDYRVPGAESQDALELLTRRLPASAGLDGKLVFAVNNGDLRHPEQATAIKQTVEGLSRLAGVTLAALPQQVQLSEDSRIGVVDFTLAKRIGEVEPADVRRVLAAAGPAREIGIRTELGGAVATAAARPEPGRAELVGLAAAMLILLLAFGSAVAMAVPVLMALIGLGVGLGLLNILAKVIEVPASGTTLATMIGLGVGIDYALFIVTRHRTQLATGVPVTASIGRALATSGSAVVFAGITVVIAISGLAIAGIPLVTGVGYATSLVVVLTVIAAITLLPALLALLGSRINRLRVRRPSRAGHDDPDRWRGWSDRIGRHPWLFAVAGLSVMTLLAAPALSLRLGQPDAGSSSTTTTERRAYDLLAQGFGPGINGPLLLAVELQPGASALAPGRADPRLTKLVKDLDVVDGVAAITPPLVGPDRRVATLTVIPESAPQDRTTRDLIERLRNQVLTPAAHPDLRIAVGGHTATFVDLADRVTDRLPWFITAVILLSCLVLLAVFRSVVIPLQAALMNVLSIGAALGVITLVFQNGVALGLVGLDEPVPIISFVPLLMFAVLFGLSMDYQVFLVSSIREARMEGHGNSEAVVAGLSRTGRVITSAALIMIAVFGSFILSDDPLLKIFGVGLSIAVLLDATIIRCVLVPAVMILCGRANWWLPTAGWSKIPSPSSGRR